ncbi:Malate dehydrogenase, cytoplasmic [Marasmius tenuissimus]|uniref:Malate dehydrogenase n=1 Tax=Marasmius tenuissimus TaxID=585030 RepID=A0ABR2ZHJ4_9AGAR
MFSRAAARTLTTPSARFFSSSPACQTKVAVLGAGGGIGQPLSLLLKSDPLVTSLSLYDIRGAPGVAADVSHVDTASEVTGYAADQLNQALEGVEVVVIPAGVPRKPGTLEKLGVFDPKRLFGVTTLDVVRAARFLAGVADAKPSDTPVTVIGGHSGPTIVPLLSQSSHGKSVTGEVYEKLVHRIQFGGDEVVKAKDGAGSATLSMAYAGAKFTNALLRGLNGEKGVVTPTFVKSPLYEDQGIDFFSSNVELGPNGVEKIHPIGSLSAEEEKLMEACLPELKKNIEKGKAFVA